MRELAREDEASREAIVRQMIADWPGKPSAAVVPLIEDYAGRSVRARRLRSYGRHREAAEASRLLARTGRILADMLPQPVAPGAPSPAPSPRPSALEVLTREASK